MTHQQETTAAQPAWPIQRQDGFNKTPQFSFSNQTGSKTAPGKPPGKPVTNPVTPGQCNPLQNKHLGPTWEIWAQGHKNSTAGLSPTGALLPYKKHEMAVKKTHSVILKFKKEDNSTKGLWSSLLKQGETRGNGTSSGDSRTPPSMLGTP